LRRALGAGHRQQPELAAGHVLQAGAGIEHELHLPCQQVAQGRGRALVRHVHGVQLAGAFEHLGSDMRRAAVAGRAVAELARMLAHIGDERVQRLRRHRRMHQQVDPHKRHRCDRGQVLERVVWHLLVEEGVDGHRAARGQQEGIAIGRRLGHGIAANDAVGARAVVDHHRTLQRLGQTGRDAARQRIRGPAGREVDDQPDRLVRPRLRGGRRAHASQQARSAQCGAKGARDTVGESHNGCLLSYVLLLPAAALRGATQNGYCRGVVCTVIQRSSVKASIPALPPKRP
jgi:hypothetical protein